jgi:hypothetical protein
MILRLSFTGSARSGARDYSRFDGAAPRDPRAAPGAAVPPADSGYREGGEEGGGGRRASGGLPKPSNLDA